MSLQLCSVTLAQALSPDPRGAPRLWEFSYSRGFRDAGEIPEGPRGPEGNRPHSFSVSWCVNRGACSSFVLECMEVSQQSPSCPENPWVPELTASRPTLPIKSRCVDCLRAALSSSGSCGCNRKLFSVISEGITGVPPGIALRFDSEIRENEAPWRDLALRLSQQSSSSSVG